MAFKAQLTLTKNTHKNGFRSNLRPASVGFAECQALYASEDAERQISNGATLFMGNDGTDNYRMNIDDGDPVFFLNTKKNLNGPLPNVLSALNGYDGLPMSSHTVTELAAMLREVVKNDNIVQKLVSDAVRLDLTYVGMATQKVVYNKQKKQTTIAVHGIRHAITYEDFVTGDLIEWGVPTQDEISNVSRDLLRTSGVTCDKVTLRPRRRVPRDIATINFENLNLYLRDASLYFKLFNNRNQYAIPARVAAFEHKNNFIFLSIAAGVNWMLKNGVLRVGRERNVEPEGRALFEILNRGSNYFKGSESDSCAASIAAAFGAIQAAPEPASDDAELRTRGRAYAVMENKQNRVALANAREKILRSILYHPKIADSHRDEFGFRGDNAPNHAYTNNNRQFFYLDRDSDLGRFVILQHECATAEAVAQMTLMQESANFTSGFVTAGAPPYGKVEYYEARNGVVA